jgi:hypothetical protein
LMRMHMADCLWFGKTAITYRVIRCIYDALDWYLSDCEHTIYEVSGTKRSRMRM